MSEARREYANNDVESLRQVVGPLDIYTTLFTSCISAVMIESVSVIRGTLMLTQYDGANKL